MLKQALIAVFALIMTFPLSAQIRNEIVGKKLIYKTYDKRDREKATMSYQLVHQNDGNYVLQMTTDSKKSDPTEVPLIATKQHITVKGALNISSLNNTGMDVSSATGEIIYPVEVSDGQELPASYFKAILGDGQALKTTLSTISERKVIGITTIETPIGELNAYVIELNTTMEMKMNGIKMPTPKMKTVEYFCPSIGLAVKTETYNRKGTKIIYKTLWKSIE